MGYVGNATEQVINMNIADKESMERLIISVSKLHDDIDLCIGDLVKSRLNKDEVAEGKAMAQMESLMVSSQQEFSYIRDYLQELHDTEFKNSIKLNSDEYTKATQEINEHMKNVEAKFRSAKASSEMAVSDFKFTD